MDEQVSFCQSKQDDEAFNERPVGKALSQVRGPFVHQEMSVRIEDIAELLPTWSQVFHGVKDSFDQQKTLLIKLV